MAEIRIVLRGDLCAGSGEATGMTVDNDVCMDTRGFPYIPARRIKGILRDAAETLRAYGDTSVTEDAINALFGTAKDAGRFRVSNAVFSGIDELHACVASAPKELERAAAPLNVAKLFTSVRGQTKLKDGVAVDHSLRFTRVLDRHNALHPERDTELVAQVTFLDGADEALFRRCCDAVRHIGSKRNRGLGNVRVIYDPKETAAARFASPALREKGDRFMIRYTLRLDAPVTLPGCAELLDEIPARSVIGCLAAQVSSEDEAFNDLFLNGAVRWFSLTPRADGAHSVPAPLCLVRYRDEEKNADVFVNRLTAAKEELNGKKLKTVDGSYFALTDNGGRIVRAKSSTVYHHSNSSGELYTQEALDAGMLYAGCVETPRRLAERVLELLCTARFSFGRSKTAQYGNCSLIEPPTVKAINIEPRKLPEGTPVWVLLESDLALLKDGVYVSDAASVRAALAETLNLVNARPDGVQDYCQNHTVSGFQAQWKMPKPQIPTMRGGSIFAFLAGKDEIPAIRQLGEFPQEGMGAFRVLTMEELSSYAAPIKGKVQSWMPQTGGEGDALLKAMAAAELERRFSESVSKLYREQKKDLNVRKGTLGRVRQMVTEAADYADLLERIDSIKPSNTHSDDPTPDRDRAKKLVNAVWRCTYSKETKLMELLDNDPSKVWKKPMIQMIHLMYYGK